MKTKEWYIRKSKDVYIKKASKLGLVSRSAFKLNEIEKKYKLLRFSNSILELGASPGGWTQVILKIKSISDFCRYLIPSKWLTLNSFITLVILK